MDKGRKRKLLLVSSVKGADDLGQDGDANSVIETLNMPPHDGLGANNGAIHGLVYFDPKKQAFVAPTADLEWEPLSPRQAAARIAESQRHGVEPIFERADATQLLITGLEEELDAKRRKHLELLEVAREETDEGLVALAGAHDIPVKDSVKSLERTLGKWMAKAEVALTPAIPARDREHLGRNTMHDKLDRSPRMETIPFDDLADHVGEQLRRSLRAQLDERYAVVDDAVDNPIWRVSVFHLLDDGDGCAERHLFNLDLAAGERPDDALDGDALTEAHEDLRMELARIVEMGWFDNIISVLLQLKGMAISIDVAERRSVARKDNSVDGDEIILGVHELRMEVWPWDGPTRPSDTDKNKEV